MTHTHIHSVIEAPLHEHIDANTHKNTRPAKKLYCDTNIENGELRHKPPRQPQNKNYAQTLLCNCPF